MTRLRVAALLLILLLGCEQQVAAYTDPGTGALIWQMLAAAFVGLLFYVRRFTGWFGRKKREPKA
jgi:hypothetical protein